MSSHVTGTEVATDPRPHWFSRTRLAASAMLLALFVLCVGFSWWTRDAMAHLPTAEGRNRESGFGPASHTLVDLRPWQTAQALAPLAVTAEEAEYAQESERLADHAVDQAFASALRQASAQRPLLKGEALTLANRVQSLQRLVKDDQARVQALTKASGRAETPGPKGAAPPATLAPDDLDVAQAQLGLDSDELTDAQQDLARAVGDERGRIQQELAAHEASMRKYDATVGKENALSALSNQRYGTLARRMQAWFDQRSREQLVQQAITQTEADVRSLTAQHNLLLSQASAAPDRTATTSVTSDESGAVPDRTAQVDSIHKRAAQQQLLSIYDDRIQTAQQLASVYEKWSSQIAVQHRIVLHLLLQSSAVIALLLLGVVLLDALARRLVQRFTLDRRRMHTLRTLFQLGVRVVGVALILLVFFGVPRQMPTIIGFTTAGITVVLQDFILGFLGWFVLMGKNGIRVGDWVEINGVGGEVVETGLFRTVMLETGNWTDKGHPTGRRVALMNSFAVKGQYFNFSTTGQWMWDEITVTIPPTENSYRLIERIHKAVLEQTETDARVASQEWQRVTRRNSMGHFAAASSVDMRPGIYGIDLVVRYVTRASERFEVRNRLYQSVIDLLHASAAPRPLQEQLESSSS